MTLIAQITDSHIREAGRLAYDRLDTAPYLRQAVASLLRLPQQPDAVILTGDLVDFGLDAEYAYLLELLKPLPMPVYVLPGNHDDRAALQRCMPNQPDWMQEGFCQYSVPIGDLQLIALDTQVPGADEGALCAHRLHWLERSLAQLPSHRPVVIAMHHPPFQTMIGFMDDIGLRQGAAELEAIVRRHPQIQRIICGHLHRNIQTLFGGALALTGPSPAHQISLSLAPDGPPAWTLEPPGFLVHALSLEGRVVTHLVNSRDFPGPYPFD